MSFPLINPAIQFFDSAGEPLVSGTIEFRSPVDNSLIDSYPTADDADAQTNANANPLTLNSRGEAANGLFLEDGVSYKVILKDSDGVTIWTRDDVQCPQDLTSASIGAALYPRTQAEIDISVTPSDYSYPVGDIRRYGAAVGTADNKTAIQNAINVAARAGVRVYIPGTRGTRWRFATTLYFFYDASNNPNFPSGTRQDGRLIVEGDGAPYKTDFENTEYNGSVLEYTGATGIGLNLYDSSGTESRNIVLRDFGLYANTTGFPLSAKYVPTLIMNNVFVGNNGNGGCIDIEDVWVSELSHVFTWGNGSGTAIQYNAVDAGGGNTTWTNVNAENCDIGLDIGAVYDAGRTAFIKNHVFLNCQGRENVSRNLRIRAGVGSAHFINFWSETISGATAAGVELSNMAGWEDAYANPGLIRFTGGQISSTSTDAGFVHFQIGDDTATENTDGVGNVILDGVSFGQVGTNTFAIRRHNSTQNGYLRLDNLVMHNNGGDYIVIDDEAQYGPIFLNNFSPDGVTQTNWVKNTGGSGRGYWIARSDCMVPVLGGTGSVSFANSPIMPSLTLNQSGGDLTLVLPTAPEEHECTLWVATANANQVVLDPGTNDLNGSTTDLTFDGKWCALRLSWNDSKEWTVGVAVQPQISAYTTGAHSTLRDFTGTTTAAHALSLLETLVDDLRAAGVVP